MSKKISKAIRKTYGAGSPSPSEIKHLEQGAVQQVLLSDIVNQSLKKNFPSEKHSAAQ